MCDPRILTSQMVVKLKSWGILLQLVLKSSWLCMEVFPSCCLSHPVAGDLSCSYIAVLLVPLLTLFPVLEFSDLQICLPSSCKSICHLSESVHFAFHFINDTGSSVGPCSNNRYFHDSRPLLTHIWLWYLTSDFKLYLSICRISIP